MGAVAGVVREGAGVKGPAVESVVGRGTVDVVDDNDGHRPLLLFELEAVLLFERVEE